MGCCGGGQCQWELYEERRHDGDRLVAGACQASVPAKFADACRIPGSRKMFNAKTRVAGRSKPKTGLRQKCYDIPLLLYSLHRCLEIWTMAVSAMRI